MQLIDLQTKLQLELVGYQNRLLTTHNINNRVNYYKLLLKDFNKPISEITEFPFKDFFKRVVMHDRHNIEFVIQLDENYGDATDQYQTLKTEYLIRKTVHVVESKISIY
jgi:hypothetical protein